MSVEAAQSADVRMYPVSDEGPHDPDPGDPHWQESIFFFWWDEGNGIGGVHRIGHEPNTTPATSNSWNGVFTTDGDRFRHYARPDLRAEDRLENGLISGPSRYWYDGAWKFAVEDEECELALETTEEFLGLGHLYPKSEVAAIHDDYAPQHYETAGRVRGTARVGDKTFEVDALGYRDHSWGRREWETLLAHRYFGGTVGPELTVCTITWMGLDGAISGFGAVVRDGVIQYAKSVEQ